MSIFQPNFLIRVHWGGFIATVKCDGAARWCDDSGFMTPIIVKIFEKRNQPLLHHKFSSLLWESLFQLVITTLSPIEGSVCPSETSLCPNVCIPVHPVWLQIILSSSFCPFSPRVTEWYLKPFALDFRIRFWAFASSPKPICSSPAAKTGKWINGTRITLAKSFRFEATRMTSWPLTSLKMEASLRESLISNADYGRHASLHGHNALWFK